jgi:hypothetical protein
MHTWYMWLSHRRRRPGRSGGTGCSPRVSVCGRVLCVVGCCVWSGAVCGRVLCVVGCSPHVCVVRRHWLRVCVWTLPTPLCARALADTVGCLYPRRRPCLRRSWGLVAELKRYARWAPCAVGRLVSRASATVPAGLIQTSANGPAGVWTSKLTAQPACGPASVP